MPEIIPYAEPVSLRCEKCNHQAAYRIGTFLMSKEGDVGFTACVRCEECQAPGPWAMDGETTLMVNALLMNLLHGQGKEPVPLITGLLTTFDGRLFRFGGQAEDHLLGLLAETPSAFLWTRLANLYRAGGQLDKAGQAYEAAIGLDAHDLEAWHGKADILWESDRREEAGESYRRVLELCPSNTKLPRDAVRAMHLNAAESLRELGGVHEAAALRRPGRNEPCSCGSGKKYKKCCEAQPAYS